MYNEMREKQQHIHYISSLDKEFKRLLDSFAGTCPKQIGKVHSIFKKVINFQDGNNRMYTIQTGALDNAPYSARVEGEWAGDFLKSDITIAAPVMIESGYLQIGDHFMLKLGEGRLWDQRKKMIYPDQNTMSVFKESVEVYNKRLFLMGSNGGGKYYYIKNHTPFDQAYRPSLIEKELGERVCKLLWSLENEYEALEENVRSIIGLGYGLTPSGDDILTGLITAFNFVKDTRGNLAGEKIKAILKRDVFSTTDVSIAMLKASVEEKARENMIEFVYALCSNSEALIDSIDKMFSIGSSSGTDLSIGTVIGLMYSLNISENGGI